MEIISGSFILFSLLCKHRGLKPINHFNRLRSCTQSYSVRLSVLSSCSPAPAPNHHQKNNLDVATC